MKLSTRILLMLMCACMILAIPFLVPAPNMTEEAKEMLLESEEEGEDTGDEIDFGRLFLSTARAEEEDLTVETLDEGELSANPDWALPIDFSTPPAPDKTKFTENGYKDECTEVTIETIEGDHVFWYVAHIRIASPTQLRTAISGKKPAHTSKMAEVSNAVIAINGDYYMNDPNKTTFEWRMGESLRKTLKGNNTKDILIIDDQGDFHLYPKSGEDGEVFNRKKKGGKTVWEYVYPGTIVNAFTFGPALVIDGEVQALDDEYGYNRTGSEPRAAIGQTGKLSYVFVIAATTDRKGHTGVNHKELAQFMYDLGCTQAYNLDGGGSAEIWFNGRILKGSPNDEERSISDIIYIATCVPEGE